MKRITATGLAVAAVVIALAGSGLSAQASARTYVPSFSAVKKDKGPVFRQRCLVFTNRVTSPPCHYGVVGSEKKVFVLGDSHALQWTPALIGIAERRGWELTTLLRKNCTAALVNISPVCNRWRQNALKRIRQEKPRMVFVASNTAANTYVVRKGMHL
ncbi:MAG TPA: SGNH hydrolase domain-containing protein, partial [Solirubrobacterales bacterium]|nr:SGNH hydrolase domain-containing protein [Solirubrobacterales bacterium]